MALDEFIERHLKHRELLKMMDLPENMKMVKIRDWFNLLTYMKEMKKELKTQRSIRASLGQDSLNITGLLERIDKDFQ